MKSLKWYSTALMFVLTKTVFAYCDVSIPFNDPFTSASNSDLWWTTVAGTATKTVMSGTMTVANTDAASTSIIKCVLASPKPATFTLSFKTVNTGLTENIPGMAFCMNLSTTLNGYVIHINAPSIMVYRYTNNVPTSIINVNTSHTRSDTNLIAVSKSGSLFNIFCNGHFVAQFSDALPTLHNSGDIALVVSAKDTVKFDDVEITSNFVNATPDTTFFDQFSDGIQRDWLGFSGNSGSIQEANGVLRLKTLNSQIGLYTDLELSTFRMRVEASHHGGSSNFMYGLLLIGPAVNTVFQDAVFGIRGDRNYGIYSIVSGESPSILSGSKPGSIKGACFVDPGNPLDTTFYIDTLELIKGIGTSEYCFTVNGDTMVNSFGHIPFAIKGFGLLTQDSMVVNFDNFSVSKGTNPTPVMNIRNRKGERPTNAKFEELKDLFMYDIQGRLVGRYDPVASLHLSKGTYMITDKNKQIIQVIIKTK